MLRDAPSIYPGPSIYAPRPVLRYTLALPAAETLPREIDRASLDALVACVPGLREDRDAQGALDAPGHTALHRLFEHVCIALENLTGLDLHCVRADAEGGCTAVDDAIVPYEDERVGLEAGKLGLELIAAWVGAGPPVDIPARVEQFQRFAERRALPIQDRAILDAARARDIPVTRIAGRIVQLGHGRHQQRISGTQTSRTDGIGSMLAANKDYARRVLGAVGLPVVSYERVDRRRAALAAAEGLGFPVVVKPNNANMGRGVSVGMKTAREVREAYNRAREYDRSVIVEKFVAGTDYRMLVIDGKLQAAAKRVPAHVVGDGTHTIEELVSEANRDPRRGAGQRSSWTRLELDEQSDRLLAELGYRHDSVARQGELVFLRRNANTSSGGTAVDVTDQVHPHNRDIAERAARTIGLDIAGVDLLVNDISSSMREQGGVICEINSRPGIRKHLWPAEGSPRDVIAPILDMLFPRGRPSRIPIAAVTGTGNTTATARLFALLLSGDGATVGLAASDGVYIGGRRMDGGGLDGPSAARMLLLDPAVDVAVIELPPGDVLRHGLGFDWCDTCAVIDGGQASTPELAEAIRVVIGATRRSVVLSADDERCRALESSGDARLRRIDAGGQESAYVAALALWVTASGSLFVVGGKDGRNGDRILLARFLELCGGPSARVLVITTASAEPDRQDQEYAEAFSKLGARTVSIVHPERRTDADDPALLSELDRAAGVYFSGGGQRKLVATLGGSKFHACLRARHRKGLHVGGTSAGAAALSKVMIAGGHELSTGFGLLPGVIVDQHFQQRQRMGRLFAAVIRHPRLLGFGVDEGTAAEIDPSGRVSVLGAGALTVVDGSRLVRGSPGAPLSFAGLRLDSLGQGWSYNLKTREAEAPRRVRGAKKGPPAGRAARRRVKLP